MFPEGAPWSLSCATSFSFLPNSPPALLTLSKYAFVPAKPSWYGTFRTLGGLASPPTLISVPVTPWRSFPPCAPADPAPTSPTSDTVNSVVRMTEANRRIASPPVQEPRPTRRRAL